MTMDLPAPKGSLLKRLFDPLEAFEGVAAAGFFLSDENGSPEPKAAKGSLVALPPAGARDDAALSPNALAVESVLNRSVLPPKALGAEPKSSNNPPEDVGTADPSEAGDFPEPAVGGGKNPKPLAPAFDASLEEANGSDAGKAAEVAATSPFPPPNKLEVSWDVVLPLPANGSLEFLAGS